jgi:type VI secretion system protein ImpI
MRPILTLTVIGPSDLAPEDRTRRLEAGRLRIGRDGDNDWVIEDPARLISRHHCTIMASGGLFTVIDTSVNGLVINDAERPLGRGNSALLSDGDILHLAGIEVAVALAEVAALEIDPLRAVLPQRKGMTVDSITPPAAPPQQHPSSLFPVPRPSPFVPGSAEPPPWLRPPMSTGPSAAPAQVTPDDHVPAERQAFVPHNLSPQLIPDDWDADLQPAPAAAHTGPAQEPGGTLTHLLIEALARIAAASGEAEARLLEGPPDAVLARLEDGDRAWTALALASLSATIAARLAGLRPPPQAPGAPHPFNTDPSAEGDMTP